MTHTVLLGDLVDVVKGISYRSSDYSDSVNGLAFVNLKSVERGGGYRKDGIKYYAGELKHTQYVEPGDILIANTDLTQDRDIIGSPIIMPDIGRKACFSLDLSKLLIREPELIDKNYLFYYLKSPRARDYMISHSNGSTVMHLSVKSVPKMPIELPPIDEQRKIAHGLRCIDEKIELNQQMNETLEQLGQALFRYYFIDNSEAEKWDKKPLSEQAEILSGGTPKTSEKSYWDGDIPWFSVVDAPNDSDLFTIQTSKNITEAGLNNSAAKLIPKYTTIISARGTVGKLAIAGKEMTINQSCYALKSENPFFIYLVISQCLSSIKARVHGSVFDTITRSTFEQLKFVAPPSEARKKFEREVEPIFLHILNNVEENQTFTTLRDTLLPRLISGKVKV